MEWTEFMGLLGAFLSSITFMPQVIRAWKTKSVGDLSMNMLLIVFISTIVWLIYAIPQQLIPVILANSIIFVLSLILIYFKLTFKNEAVDQK